MSTKELPQAVFRNHVEGTEVAPTTNPHKEFLVGALGTCACGCLGFLLVILKPTVSMAMGVWTGFGALLSIIGALVLIMYMPATPTCRDDDSSQNDCTTDIMLNRIRVAGGSLLVIGTLLAVLSTCRHILWVKNESLQQRVPPVRTTETTTATTAVQPSVTVDV
eukprot:PhF_6_TR16586/c0_g1_i1/m.25275